MGAERQTKIASSLPIFAVLAIMGGAYYVSQSPLKSSRPEAPAGLREPVLEKDEIEARLWQDPLKVALDHEEAMHDEEGKTQNKSGGRECASLHCVSQISEQIDCLIEQSRKGKKDRHDANVPIVHVLLTIGRDGTFAEDHERRLRNRYAMLTALGAHGLSPEDSKHIQYFKLPLLYEQRRGQTADGNVPKVDNFDSRPRPVVVPFEWCNRTELYPPDRKNTCPEHALIVWLGESVFSKRPLARLAQVIDAIKHKGNPDVKIDVIGPSRSTTLRDMLKEVDDCKDYAPGGCDLVDVNSMLTGLTIFSPWSTASPILTMEDDANYANMRNETGNSENSVWPLFERIRNKFDRINVTYVRMIGSDDLLAMELINELLRRGVNVVPGPDNVGDHLALICEWDTFYGGAFPLAFATMMDSVRRTKSNARPLEPNWVEYAAKLREKKPSRKGYFPRNLHTYSYIRGIDGRLPESEAAAEEESKNETETESKWAYSKSLELPIGRGQLDYVRRLAQKLVDENRYAKGEDKLKAIGVVGTDVYDKLILLHALRERFSNIILFTIDIDSRMMHYEQSEWTRNVIVASNYGLELSRQYQCSIYEEDEGRLPPFRDNYQTALFLSCRAALGLPTHVNKIPFRELCGEQLAAMVSRPRVFEIGHGRAVNLTVSDRNPKDIARVHPDHSRWPGWNFLKYAAYSTIAAGMCITLLARVNEGVRSRTTVITSRLLKVVRWIGRMINKASEAKDKKSKKKKRKKKTVKDEQRGERLCAIAIFVLGAISVLFVTVVIFDHYRPGGEPFSLFSGVSIWPGEALRLLAAILSVCFIVKSITNLHKNEEYLYKNFGLSKPERQAWTLRLFVQGLDPRTWLACIRKRKTIYNWAFKEEDRCDAMTYWDEYLERATLGNRLFRVIIMVLAYGVLGWMLMLLLGWPNRPYRGKVSFWADVLLLGVSVASMIALIFFVVDATRLSVRFIRGLKGPRTDWPETLTRCYTKNNGALKALNEWLDIKFIAAHTEAVGKLIYYPFIVLLLMFMARNRYFDNWNFPISLIIIFLLSSACALVSGWRLRSEAERTRRLAIERLKEDLVEAQAGQNKGSIEQIKAMIEDVECIEQGAYSPFSENPLVHAILIPSGGMSLLTLLRFLPFS